MGRTQHPHGSCGVQFLPTHHSPCPGVMFYAWEQFPNSELSRSSRFDMSRCPCCRRHGSTTLAFTSGILSDCSKPPSYYFLQNFGTSYASSCEYPDVPTQSLDSFSTVKYISCGAARRSCVLHLLERSADRQCTDRGGHGLITE